MTRQSVRSKSHTVNLANRVQGANSPSEASSESSLSHSFEFAASLNMSLTLVGRAAGAEVYSSPRDRTYPREYYRYALISPAWGGPCVDGHREWWKAIMNRQHRTPSLIRRKTLVFGLVSLALMATLTLAAAELLARRTGIHPWAKADLLAAGCLPPIQ